MTDAAAVGLAQPEPKPAPAAPPRATPGQALAATTTAGAGATSAVEVYRWMLSGFPAPVPDTVVMALALATLPLIHALTMGALAWVNKRFPSNGNSN